ncbi:hypothetical protein SAMN05421786_101187 [Chryseobacterium ureilyticum]|uniref:Uncharacterized protein n=1 Tax=Chryseobacterium ureilyticum TaxID=373668 RepID=A0A1N7K1N0_9FLAO|nr:hypothetical protein [Chryseobacterium ureilyticum]SIS55515.1 hypothetical protein SAMN05421786_101187 [Chryseobacterium ureilyticum]
MSDTKIHMKTYKAIIMMLILAFSLSPCSVKRNVLDIFDIQYISGLNKVKTTSNLASSCDFTSISSKISVSKTVIKAKHSNAFLDFTASVKNIQEGNLTFNDYSGHTTGNSPPKYILFKRLKLNLV